MKKVISLILVMCIIGTLVGCDKGENPTTTPTEPTSTTESIPSSTNLVEDTNPVEPESTMPTEPEVVIIKNLTNITNKKLFLAITNIVTHLLDNSEEYETYLYTPEDAYMSALDLEYILSHMGLDILDTYKLSELSVSKVSVEEENKRYHVVLIGNDSSTYNLNLRIDEDGQYKLDLSSFFATNVTLRIPTTETVLMDEIKIPEMYLDSRQDQVSIYVFPGIVMKKHYFVFNSAVLPQIQCRVEFTADDSDKEKDMYYRLSSAESEQYLEFAKKLYQSVVKNMIETGTVDSIRDYFINTYSEELLLKYVNEPFKNLNLWQGYPIINKIAPRNDIKCVIIGHNTVQLYFKYELVFDGYTNEGEQEVGLITSDIAHMTITTTDNLNWKIVDVDTKLFLAKCDFWIKNWDNY